jgi:peptidoglycan/LPS O-acetylase OafA/YrhL
MQAVRPFGVFRFVLALMVFLQHALHIAPESYVGAWFPLGTGNIGVLVFFAMSGFVIMEAADLFYKDRPISFITNRALRIIPPFLVAMAIIVAIKFLVSVSVGLKTGNLATGPTLLPVSVFSFSNIAANFFSIIPGSNLVGLSPDHHFNEVTWALRIEFLFYLAIMALITLGGFSGRFRIISAFAGLGLVAFVLNAVGLAPAAFGLGPYFLFGAALYWAQRGSSAALLVAATSIVAVAANFWVYDAAAWDQMGPLLGMRNHYFQYSMLFGLLAVMAVLARLPTPAWLRPFDKFMGDLSYPFYLLHTLPISIALSFEASRSAETIVAAALAAVGFSIVLLFTVEPMTGRLRDRIRGIRLDRTGWAATGHRANSKA